MLYYHESSKLSSNAFTSSLGKWSSHQTGEDNLLFEWFYLPEMMYYPFRIDLCSSYQMDLDGWKRILTEHGITMNSVV